MSKCVACSSKDTPFSAASSEQTPCARTMSPSNSSGPATFVARNSSSLARGKDRTLVGLSLPRHSAFSSRTFPLPVSRTEISIGRPLIASCGKALSAIAASAAFRTSSSQERLLSHSSSASTAISSITGVSSPGSFIGLDDATNQRVAHDVGGGESDSGDPFPPLELSNRVGEAGFGWVGQVDLVRIAADHHSAAHSEARQEHLHLQRRRVLRLVEDDEGVVERPAAHDGEGSDLDFARRD